MRTYIAIPVLKDDNKVADVINMLLGTCYMERTEGNFAETIDKAIFIYDVTENGINKELLNFIKSYSKFNVHYKREKISKKYSDPTVRLNIALGTALRHFNIFQKEQDQLINSTDSFTTFLWMTQNISFENFDLQLFVENAQIYHAISPVVRTLKGLEIYSGIFHRFGIEFVVPEDPTDYVTGEVEDTYALNPKCFALSRQFARKLKDFVITDEDPIDYLNSLVYDNHTDQYPRLDSNTFVHEHLY